MPAVSVRSATVEWESLGLESGRGEIQTLITDEHSAGVALGLCRFERCSFPWKLTYDECLYVLEGWLEVHEGENVARAESGEALFIARGSEVVYSIPERCLALFAVHPANWQATMEQ